MKKHFLLVVVCIAVCAALLTACDKGPDTEKTKLELVAKTEPETEIVVGTNPKLPEMSREETSKPEEETESSYDSVSSRTRMLAERVLVLFANQCLDMYYSDFQLLEYRNIEDKKGIQVSPGSSLYYRIDAYEYDDLYKVSYSSDESFTRFHSIIYRYNDDEDRFQEISTLYNSLKTVASGKLVIPEEYIDYDVSRKKAVQEAFSEFWKDWQSTDAVKDTWPISVKHAYLMPFSLDEYGNAELCIFLEREDGVWMMGRAAARSEPLFEETVSYRPGVFIEWYINPDRLSYSLDYARLVWVQYNPAGDYDWNSLSKNPYFDRFYCPDSSGYRVYDYYGNLDPSDKERRGAPSDGSFLASVPDLALLELPLEDSLAHVPGSENGVKEAILSYDYDAITDRLVAQMKNRCLEWYYNGTSFDFLTKEGEVKPKPGAIVNYDVYLHRPSMTFRIQCYEGEEFPEEWLWGSPPKYSENYLYSMRKDSLMIYPGYLPIEEKISSGSFTIPNSFEAQPDPMNPEYIAVIDGIHEIWEEFKVLYDQHGWPAFDTEFMYCDEITGAYLMPFSIGENGSLEAHILIEMKNGNWLMMQIQNDFLFNMTGRENVVWLSDISLLFDKAALDEWNMIIGDPDLYQEPIPRDYKELRAKWEYVSKVPELALEKLY